MELEDRVTGCSMWPGSQYKYHGKTCTYNEYSSRSADPLGRVDIIMSWLTNQNKPAELVMFYLNQPDDTEHQFGKDSIQVSFRNNYLCYCY